MGTEIGRSVGALRAWSAVRWALIAALLLAAGATTGFAQIAFTLELSGIDEAILGGFVQSFALLVLFADFPRAHERGDRWRWLIIRFAALALVAGGLGPFIRQAVLPIDAPEAEIDAALRYGPWAVWAGLVPLAIEALLWALRVGAVRLFGAPRATAGERRRRWPGSQPLLWAGALIGLAALAVPSAALLERAAWHIYASASTQTAPTAAAGTVDGVDTVLVRYQTHSEWSFRTDVRAAAFDAATGELLWDVSIELAEGVETYQVVSIDDRGAFLSVVDIGTTGRPTTWIALDAVTGAETAEAVPEDVAERSDWLTDHVDDLGIDHVAVDGDVERTYRYGESRLVFAETGRPAGEGDGLRLDRSGGESTELRVDGDLVDAFPQAIRSDAVAAETPGGRVAMVTWAAESKAQLVIADRDGFRSTVVGDRGWWPHLGSSRG